MKKTPKPPRWLTCECGQRYDRYLTWEHRLKCKVWRENHKNDPRLEF